MLPTLNLRNQLPGQRGYYHPSQQLKLFLGCVTRQLGRQMMRILHQQYQIVGHQIQLEFLV